MKPRPHSRITNEALATVRRSIPRRSQAGARNALLALAEGCSLRRDPERREGDTLRQLSELAGVSERRLRDHLAELAGIGLVRVDEHQDAAGRDLPKIYVLCDLSRPDEMSAREDGSPDEMSRESSGPTRASDVGPQEEEQEETPLSLNGNAARRVSEREREQVEFDPRNLVKLRRIPS